MNHEREPDPPIWKDVLLVCTVAVTMWAVCDYVYQLWSAMK